jgi:hypothetical protein
MSTSPDRQLELPVGHPLEAIYDLNDRLHAYFAAELATPAGAGARDHLESVRGLPSWMIQEAALGYVRPAKGLIIEWARAHGVLLELCAEAGVVKRSARYAARMYERQHGAPPPSDRALSEYFAASLANKPEAYSDFPILVKEPEPGQDAGRPEYCYGDWITIPIRVEDAAGCPRIGGFQFRSMRADIDKNDRYRSPLNTTAMTWNRTLIGLAEERAVLAQSRQAVLCEGRFDQLSARAALRDQAAATRPAVFALGGINVRGVGQEAGATPRERAGVLGLIDAEEVFLLLDSDVRGTEAILKVGPVLRVLGAQVYIVRLADVWDDAATGRPAPKDASELYALPGGAALLAAAIAASRARPLASYAAGCLETTLSALPHAGQVWHRLRALDDLVPILGALPGAERTACVARVADALSFPTEVVDLAVAQEGNQALTQSPRGGHRPASRPAAPRT